MTKADIVNAISAERSLEKEVVQTVIEDFMAEVKNALGKHESVYLRGFGTFNPVYRKEKKCRNITEGTSLIVPGHFAPKFKPSPEFNKKVK